LYCLPPVRMTAYMARVTPRKTLLGKEESGTW
jgi:hypothetical protein